MTGEDEDSATGACCSSAGGETRGIALDEVPALIDENTRNPSLGFLNEPARNVLMVNQALEERETSH